MSKQPFRERLKHGPLLFDGAMGTELYRQGHLVNKSLDSVNLTDGALVEKIHRRYIEAGAEVIQTNTFAANRLKLREAGHAHQYEEINRNAVKIAKAAAMDATYVAGSVGPSGRWNGGSAEEHAEIVEALVHQALVLVDEGVDLIAFETFSHFAELEAAVRALRAQSDIAISATASFVHDTVTNDRVIPEKVAQGLVEAGADLVGANCAHGPRELYDVLQIMVKHAPHVIGQPNAGYPRRVDDRMIYMATPEYFGVYARRYLRLGVLAVGGCCGTTSEHIHAMSGATRMLSSSHKEDVIYVETSRDETDQPLPEVPLHERSSLAHKVASSEGFVVSVEVNPPTGLDTSKQIEAARMLQAAGVDVVNIADGPRASCRISNWALGLQIKKELDMESIIHFCARDRNLLGMQSDLMAYAVLGLNNLVVITGDPPKLGHYPDATAVFDLDAIGMLRLVKRLNRGLDPGGKSLGQPTQFFSSCGAEPAAVDYDRELRRLERKIEEGASMIMTQPVYDAKILERFLNDTDHFNIPVLVGLLPLASYRNAEFLHNEVPGMLVPQSIRDRMEKFGRGPEARAEGIRIAQEALLQVKDRVRGAYIMPPFGRYDSAIKILECIGYRMPEGYEYSV